MNKQYFRCALVLTNAQRVSFKLLSLLVLLGFASACEFIDKGSSPAISKDNPGARANLAEAFAAGPSDNNYRMIQAVKRVQYCEPNVACTQTDMNYITYTYAGSLLDSVVEETTVNIGREVTSRRQYHYVDSNDDSILDRLDKVSVRLNGNFHTLHDYFYDDENDGDFDAINISRPKLRREYICDIDLPVVTTEICNRDNAAEVINYVYYETGYLYRKEFDVNNDAKIEHQKIYYYQNNELVRVDTDNFYNGKIDERYEYEQSDELGLRVFVDNGYVAKTTRGIDKAISYKIGYNQNYVATAGQEVFSYDFYLSNTSQLTVVLNGTVLTETTDYDVFNILTSPFGGTIDLVVPAAEGDELALSAHDTVLDKECYFNRTTANECTNNSAENTHWVFVWEEESAPDAGNCWAGGLDDIDPEARAIDYLCKQRD